MPCVLIDTSGSTILLGVCDEEGGLLAALHENHTPANAAALKELTLQALNQAGVELQEVRCGGVGCGPGSFIGTRTGVAFANGLAAGIRIPLVGVDSLHAAVADTTFDAEHAVVLRSARRKSYFLGIFRQHAGVVDSAAETAELAAECLPELRERLALLAGEGGLFVVTDSLSAYETLVKEDLPPRAAIVLRENVVAFGGLAGLTVRGLRERREQPWVEAKYLRPPV